MSFDTNFEPVYAALAALLINSGSSSVAATATAGSPTLTGIADTSPLVPGLAVTGDAFPVGTVVVSADGIAGTALLSQGATAGSAGPFRVGYVSADPAAARLLRHWSQVQASEQPALFLAQVNEHSEKRPTQPAKWTLNAMVYVYCQAPDDRTPSAPALNALLGAVRAAFAPDRTGPGRAGNRQTLGGLVFDAWIEGIIETDEGYLGQQAVAKVPVRIIQNGP